MQWLNQAIKKEMELMDSKFDKEKCQQRIAALGGGIARIKVRGTPCAYTNHDDCELALILALSIHRKFSFMGIISSFGLIE